MVYLACLIWLLLSSSFQRPHQTLFLSGSKTLSHSHADTMARPLPLKIKPNFRTPTPFRHFSSSSPPSANQTPNPDQTPNHDQNTVHQPSPSYSSLFSDIKQRLRSPQPPPRRIPNDPPPPLTSPDRPPVASLEEIRKRLAEFRSQNPNPNPTQDRPVSFQELFKNNNAAVPNSKPERFSFGSIRESLERSRPMGVKDPQKFQSQFSFKPGNMGAASLIGNQESLPQSIFGREMREKTGEKDGGWDEETKELKTEFVKMYSPEELGEKLRRLRPSDAEKGGKDWSLLEEMNVRLAKLRELEVKETESRMGGVMYSDLRKSLLHLARKKPDAVQRMSILTNIGLQTTPSFMLKPPQEQLLENYFHPDHMSSAEKMKLELKKVRDEFKMSESDFGSTHVQVAQLTTKIKHLSSVLHKKDKHSRKGLNEMVQRRKKLLKYLRRKDWDSYCFVLSKLGLRDVPEYKVPDYKC